MSRTIFVRSDPWRAVVKPYERSLGGVNLLPADSLEAAQAHAQTVADLHGWPIVDETAAPEGKGE